MKERLDILVQQQAGISRSRAQGMILTGMVFSREGEKLDKPGLRLPPDTILDIREEPRFVSRGGEKLDAAMEAFQLDVTGKVAIDVGASTGGFTDCLLQRGAARVYAVDVGYGQLAWKLRQDPRVVVMERTNARHLEPGTFPERPEFFAADCSFISLRLVLQPLRGILAPHAEGVVLVKPQFEAGRELVGKGGVVRDESVHQQVLDDVGAAARQLGFSPGPVIPSPLLGPAGNREFLMHLSLDPEPPRPS
ncbi:MAG: TlyA family RNA methyltransferase [Candidatus Hydrogenedentes bacterium]|nr:TlyA family RNA methyltransferase [Candidatus Hydrogenedentota bacterium]